MARRIVVDIRTLVESKGQSDGIVRTVRALAQYAAAHRSDVILGIFDPDYNAFRAVRKRWVNTVLAGAKVDTSHFADPLGKRPRLREKFPLPLRRIALAIQRPRRRAFLLVERWRLNAPGPTPWLDRLQARLTSAKYLDELTDGRGGRRVLLPFDVATGEPLVLGPRDIVLLAGSDWSAMHRIAVSRPASEAPQLCVLCHDIIPLLMPHFFRPHDAQVFRTCFHALFPRAALTILTTHRVESDVRRYCEDQGLRLGRTAVVPLGTDFARVARKEQAALPDGLRFSGYALFVSTIEPRKNHRVLFEAWKRLLASRIPQKHDFKLVFVGRQGWMMQDFIDEMRAHESFGKSLLLLSNVDDATLASLYANAAFCAYPSSYEGFGLPVIEGFRYGKAVIASTGGALPETVNRFSICLDPTDVAVWSDTLSHWITDPSAYSRYEQAIASEFQPRSWDEASRELFAAIDKLHVNSLAAA